MANVCPLQRVAVPPFLVVTEIVQDIPAYGLRGSVYLALGAKRAPRTRLRQE